MSNNSFRFSQKVVGQERKAIATVIAEALEGGVRYAGAPGFAYEVNDGSTAGSWTVDRDSVVHSPEIGLDKIKSVRPVIDAMNIAGLSAEENMTIALALHGFGEASLENLKNLLASKETLLKKALSVKRNIEVSAENGEITFPFWNATLNADEVQTYITLAKQMAEQAGTQKRRSECWLPRNRRTMKSTPSAASCSGWGLSGMSSGLSAGYCFQGCPATGRTGKAEQRRRMKMNDFHSAAFFVKHPFRIEDLKVPHRYEMRKRFAVVKTIELSKIDYENFIADLCVDRLFIEENKGLCRIDEDGVWRCLLVKQRGRSDGVLVMPDGRDYPKYAAYYPGEEDEL